jgi:hypothetical protein
MNFTYSYQLFERQDTIRAFNYLRYDYDYLTIDKADVERFQKLVRTHDDVTYLILAANMKKVQDICVDKLLPYLSLFFDGIGQKHGYVIFNPTRILNAYNPFQVGTIDKIIPYIRDEMYNMPNLWIYFEGFVSDTLEQIINLKYHKYVFKSDNGRTYLRLTPQCDFSLVYEFIDDMFLYG